MRSISVCGVLVVGLVFAPSALAWSPPVMTPLPDPTRWVPWYVLPEDPEGIVAEIVEDPAGFDACEVLPRDFPPCGLIRPGCIPANPTNVASWSPVDMAHRCNPVILPWDSVPPPPPVPPLPLP